MKKFCLAFLFIFIFSLNARADIMPHYVSSINPVSIGVYQAQKKFTVYKEPNEKSEKLLEVAWDVKNFKAPETSAGNLFLVFIPTEELAFLQVTDDNEDWVEVIYDKKNNLKGWVKKDDPFKLLTWRFFFNSYARKYGVYIFKDAPEITSELYGSNIETSNVVNRIKLPQKITFNTMKGNWILVSVYDFDKIPKMGFLKWRSQDGYIYAFPAIK